MSSYFKSAVGSYKFGELTKLTLGALKGGAQLYTGKDEYQFGDISKKTTEHLTYLAGYGQATETEAVQEPTMKEVITEDTDFDFEVIPKQKEVHEDRNSLFESLQDGPATNTDIMNTFSKAFWSPRIHHHLVFTPSEVVQVEVIWDSFFDRAHEISSQCLQLGVLTIDDFQCEEPFLYIGLPSLILIEVVHRSLDCPDGFILSTGMKLTQGNCPEKEKLLFVSMQASRDRLQLISLNKFELAVMKLRMLFAGEESKEVPPELRVRVSVERLSAINAVVAEVTSVAIHLTQEGIFKKRFREIFQNVTDNI